MNHELMLRNVLFNQSRYCSQVIPRRNVTENVEIVMKWNFIRLEGLFEKEARLSQSIGMDLKWKDDYLVWDPSLYGGKSYLTASGKEVWTPDFTIFNRLESSFLSDGLQAEKVLVKYDGTINAQPYGELNTICNADTASFPADCLQNVNPEIVLRSALFNESTYNAQVIPRRNVTDTVQISLKWNFVRLKDLV
ncbi:acetylcholine receptor subunit beta-like [Mytilus edulis]|uniref:acetylcholine receptor subunit beta-like n=1 Tax=Mytilus edulis TaxID=6550 RepID=UPI0039F03B08